MAKGYAWVNHPCHVSFRLSRKRIGRGPGHGNGGSARDTDALRLPVRAIPRHARSPRSPSLSMLRSILPSPAPP